MLGKMNYYIMYQNYKKIMILILKITINMRFVKISVMEYLDAEIVAKDTL